MGSIHFFEDGKIYQSVDETFVQHYLWPIKFHKSICRVEELLQRVPRSFSIAKVRALADLTAEPTLLNAKTADQIIHGFWCELNLIIWRHLSHLAKNGRRAHSALRASISSAAHSWTACGHDGNRNCETGNAIWTDREFRSHKEDRTGKWPIAYMCLKIARLRLEWWFERWRHKGLLHCIAVIQKTRVLKLF